MVRRRDSIREKRRHLIPVLNREGISSSARPFIVQGTSWTTVRTRTPPVPHETNTKRPLCVFSVPVVLRRQVGEH